MHKNDRAAGGNRGTTKTGSGNTFFSYYSTPWGFGTLNLNRQLKKRSTDAFDALLSDLALVRHAPSTLAALERLRVQLTLQILNDRDESAARPITILRISDRRIGKAAA